MIGEKIIITVLKSLGNGHSLAMENYDNKTIFVEGDHEPDSRLEAEIKTVNSESIVVVKKKGVTQKHQAINKTNSNNPYDVDQ